MFASCKQASLFLISEKFVVPCMCKDRIQRRSHWHCPYCRKIIYRKCNFERHISKQHCKCNFLAFSYHCSYFTIPMFCCFSSVLDICLVLVPPLITTVNGSYFSRDNHFSIYYFVSKVIMGMIVYCPFTLQVMQYCSKAKMQVSIQYVWYPSVVLKWLIITLFSFRILLWTLLCN